MWKQQQLERNKGFGLVSHSRLLGLNWITEMFLFMLQNNKRIWCKPALSLLLCHSDGSTFGQSLVGVLVLMYMIYLEFIKKDGLLMQLDLGLAVKC